MSEMMEIVVDASLFGNDYHCASCGIIMWRTGGRLEHPTVENWGFLGFRNRPSKCKNAGKFVSYPRTQVRVVSSPAPPATDEKEGEGEKVNINTDGK